MVTEVWVFQVCHMHTKLLIEPRSSQGMAEETILVLVSFDERTRQAKNSPGRM